MPSRFNCEFKRCNCQQYHRGDKGCSSCNHSKIWHSRTQSKKNQFISTRKFAHKPEYYGNIYFARCFIPQEPNVPPLPYDSLLFCYNVEALPV
jgi:hypothetical protein